MSRPPGIKLLVRDQPRRSFALATDRHALVLKGAGPVDPGTFPPPPWNPSQTNLSGLGPGAPRCVAEFGAAGAVDWDEYRPLGFRDIYGTLGLIAIGGDVFLCVVTSATQAAEIRPGEVVQKINTVEFRMARFPVKIWTDGRRLLDEFKVRPPAERPSQPLADGRCGRGGAGSGAPSV
jgi:hypothetical protein